MNRESPQVRASDVVTLTPAQFAAVQQLGYLLLRHGQYGKAKTLFTALHALRPTDLNLTASLAYARLQLAEFDDVLVLLAHTTRPSGTPPPIFHALRARALAGRADHETARESMTTFIHEQRHP
ncbi:MAG: tetratricopeptide repeat protein [Thiotrichales bacterium]